MGRLEKALLGVAAAQLACLAAGLWIQDRLLVATARWQLENQPAVVAAADPTLTAASLLTAMPSTRVLSWVWIGALQVVIACMVFRRLQHERTHDQAQSTAELLQRSRDLVKTRNAIVFGLAKLADFRDNETGQHLERIALYSTRLASAMRRVPAFRSRIDAAFIKTIGISSALHDIGKVSIEDAILRKPGKLTPHERKRMEEHTTIGADCIRQIEARLGACNFLQMARQIAQHHHERWDGTGYAGGLAGPTIPLAARIVAIADVYDALSVERVYKQALPHDECVAIIRDGAGTHFDPDIVAVFLEIESEFREIALRFAGEVPESGDAQPASERRVSLSRQHQLLNVLLESDSTLDVPATSRL